MSQISDFMTRNHRHCDQYLVEAENALQNNDWQTTSQQSKAFIAEMENHLTTEEEVLFPAFEAKTGMTQGPTQVMRAEHQQMRALFSRLNDAVTAQSVNDFLGNSESLMVLMQQHNMKEENILYPMCDAQLNSDTALVSQLSEQIGNS